jgi:GNAT superfamily N-acetyltransferase
VKQYIPQIITIEHGQPFAWEAEAIVTAIRQDRILGQVVEEKGNILAWMLYRLDERRIFLIHFRVAEEYRRQGVGTLLLTPQIERLGYKQARRRHHLIVEVPEKCLDMQLFLRSHGLKAEEVIHSHDGDIYRFRISRSPSPGGVD